VGWIGGREALAVALIQGRKKTGVATSHEDSWRRQGKTRREKDLCWGTDLGGKPPHDARGKPDMRGHSVRERQRRSRTRG